ncbi:hypothetical protein C8F04DRAFT_1300951 [Mycena alexandri]|uniref:AB hydrolase-1 domain-containing protein n=1 Tax=Mycena alexandri TaxID=1745969 RepID=A0AAD6XB43_9AGAR|nr:hypothetical protein C8F04DRAFT_1300951 [Mycena alexandri]
MSTSPQYFEDTLKLPDGVEIRYTDSGALNTSDYTTMIVIHGTGFNGYALAQLHAYAQKYNLRIVLCNRRHYHGSTKYSEEELAELTVGSKCFQDKLGLQTAWFLEHFVKNEGTPKVTADRRAGGVILVGWSFGNATTLALLADPEVIPQPVYETVEPYLRSLVLYDPPNLALGYPGTGIEEKYNPLADPSCTTPTQVFENFQKWVSSYFQHPDVASGLASGLSSEKCTDKKTIDRWTPEEKAKFCEEDGATRTDVPS